MLSQKPIPAQERLIFALDVPGVAQARRLADVLGDSILFYKVGLELFMTGEQYPLIERLRSAGKKVFADVKLYDIPNTVASALRALGKYRPDFVTVHGNDDILKAACQEKGSAGILAVTVLTSLDDSDLDDLGFRLDRRELVLSRARRALEIGCDGVVCSGWEAAAIRQALGEKLLLVVPGIRPAGRADDQKRTVTVEEAFRNGADYIVVGRPIKDAPDPRVAASDIQRRIAGLFDQRPLDFCS